MDEPELEGPKGFHSRFRVHQNPGGQTLNTGAYTPLIFDEVEYDTLGEFTLATGRFTPRRPGWYHLVGAVTFVASGAGFTRYAILMRNLNVFANWEATTTERPDALIFRKMNVSTVTHLDKGDYVRLWGYQDSGGNLNTHAAFRHFTMFAGHRLS